MGCKIICCHVNWGAKSFVVVFFGSVQSYVVVLIESVISFVVVFIGCVISFVEVKIGRVKIVCCSALVNCWIKSFVVVLFGRV